VLFQLPEAAETRYLGQIFLFGQFDLATYGEGGSPTLAADKAVGGMTGSGWGTILPKAHRIDLSFEFVEGDI
jgi:hypothetical protein